MKCEYCETEHPENEIANPHYCIARMAEQIAALTERLSQTVSCVDYKQQTCTLCTMLVAENKRLREEAAKYVAFWEQSRMVDQMKFEEYDWPRILKEGKSHE